MPEIPLSVGSKLELLLRAFVFAKFPYGSSYICPRMHNIAVYINYTQRRLGFCTLVPSFYITIIIINYVSLM